MNLTQRRTQLLIQMITEVCAMQIQDDWPSGKGVQTFDIEVDRVAPLGIPRDINRGACKMQALEKT
jgi:hypothetical protein